MKRFNKTAVALATAGAMTLAIVPNASAFDDKPSYGGAGDPATSLEQLKRTGEGENGPNLAADRAAQPAPNTDPVPNAPTIDEDGNVTDPGNDSDAGYVDGTKDDAETIVNGTVQPGEENFPPRPTKLGSEEDRIGGTPVILNKGDKIVDVAGKVQHTAQADGEFATLEPGDRVIRAGKDVTGQLTAAAGVASAGTPVTLKWGDVIVDKDGRIVWSAKANGEYAVLQEGDKVVPAGRIGVGILGGLAALTLGGVLYKVVKNSKGEPVLVPADRADQTPTAEDEKNTEKLVKENAEEIAAQAAKENGGADARTADTADRGVGAATGNNTIAKGLVGLLIASIMGAAVFAFGRRRLV